MAIPVELVGDILALGYSCDGPDDPPRAAKYPPVLPFSDAEFVKKHRRKVFQKLRDCGYACFDLPIEARVDALFGKLTTELEAAGWLVAQHTLWEKFLLLVVRHPNMSEKDMEAPIKDRLCYLKQFLTPTSH
jgi:hypothetical protein